MQAATHHGCIPSITIRNVPLDVRDRLASRAALPGRSLQEYLRTQLIDLASFLVAALIDTGPVGSWAEDLVSSNSPAGPHLLPVETANTLRRLEPAGRISGDLAALAHDDLTDLGVDLVGCEALAPRCWELRRNLTVYDASYVALAELLGSPLATMDQAMSSAGGPMCSFITPPETWPLGWALGPPQRSPTPRGQGTATHGLSPCSV